MRHLQVFACFFLYLGLAAPSAGAAVLDELVAEALAANPGIKSASARRQMAEQQALQAGTLADPMLMIGIDSGLVRDPLNLDRDMNTARVIGLSQTVPFFGKRALARQVADHEAAASRWEAEERSLEVAATVKESWYRLFLTDRSLELLERSIATLDELVGFTEALYGAGQGRQADVLRAQVERAKMEELRLQLGQQRRILEAGLNTLLYRPASGTFPTVGEVTLTAVPLDPDLLDKLADEHRPLLRALDKRIVKARAQRTLAEREFYPDVTLSLEYMQRDPVMDDPGYDMYNASVSFNLPVRRERRHAMVAESAAAASMASAELNLTRSTIRRSIAELVAEIERDRRVAGLYRDGILPQAEAAMAAALAAYRAGKGEFMQVLDSRMALFNLERDYYAAVAGHQMELARLEAVVGTSLADR